MTSQKIKETVLFICKHNSARSQMAEGLLKSLYKDSYDVYSAGSNPSTLNPYTIKVMGEAGVDISMNKSKSLNEFKGVEFDYVVTVCGGEGEFCPFFPGGKTYIHQSFDDPTIFNGNDDEIIVVFRKVRDEIVEWIIKTF